MGLDEETARRVAALTFRAKQVVTGLLSGMHRSPDRGASVVFVEHREYRPGDDPRLLDWRAFARTDRHSIKRFEQETQLRATLLIDRSGSMTFENKFEHASTLLAAFALILSRQGDAVGLGEFATQYVATLPPRTRASHIEAVMRGLAAPPVPDRETDLRSALRQAAERVGRRGVVVIASDLLDFDEHALESLGQLASRGNELLVFHVLHRDELELPAWGAARFAGCENEESFEADTRDVGEEYASELRAFLERCQQQTTAVGARYVLAPTDKPLATTLAQALSPRRRGRR